jgi:hypothetical protein
MFGMTKNESGQGNIQSSEITVFNKQIEAINKQIEAINVAFQLEHEHEIIKLQLVTAHLQANIIEIELGRIQENINNLYGSIHSKVANIAREPIDITYTVNAMNKMITGINKKLIEISLDIKPLITQSNVGVFDIVIGNPPYIDIKGLPKDEVKLYFNIFKTTENRINLYAIFIEKGTSLLNPKGVLVYINPNSILINESYKKIRKHIISGVEKIVKLPDSVFEAATVETIVLISRKKSFNKNVLGVYFAKNDKIDFKNLIFNSFLRLDWEMDDDLRFNIFGDNKTTTLLKKIESDCLPLENFVYSSLGITPYDKYKGHSENLIRKRGFHSTLKLSEEYVPLISGKNIHPFFISDEIEEYLKYGDWLGAPRDRKFFERPKIIVRQIVAGNDLKIVAGYSETTRFFTQIGFSLISKTENVDELKFILGLLNSSLINFYHKNKFLDIEKVVFQKILIANCKQLPIKGLKNIRLLSEIVDKIIISKFPNSKVDTSPLEKHLDEMVYKLYEFTYEEVKVVDPDFWLTEEEFCSL